MDKECTDISAVSPVFKAKTLETSQKIALKLCEDGFKVLILEED